MKTAFVYTVTPDRAYQMYQSIDWLVRTQTHYDAIYAFIIDPHSSASSHIADLRLTTRCVPPLFGEYVHGNKLYLCEVEAERVVFLDSDTFAFRNLDPVLAQYKADFVARIAGDTEASLYWDKAVWAATFEHNDAPVVPMYNAGFMIFNNNAHRRLAAPWSKHIHRYMAGEYALPYPDLRMYEQFGLSLALGELGLTIDHLKPTEHAYGWSDEVVVAETALYHTGSLNYDRALQILQHIMNKPTTTTTA